ncbi:MAG TPA: type II toxin-antitoxin system prevent-host-death family antitoxin [Streptosporangiaceae bacterium]
MSDTPQDDEQPLPASTGQRAARGREPGRPAARAEQAGRAPASTQIGIRELRQHASVYVDLAEKGYTVDITNRGRLVARLVPAGEVGSPLERLVAAGILEPAEEAGGAAGLDPYPARNLGAGESPRNPGSGRGERSQNPGGGLGDRDRDPGARARGASAEFWGRRAR